MIELISIIFLMRYGSYSSNLCLLGVLLFSHQLISTLCEIYRRLQGLIMGSYTLLFETWSFSQFLARVIYQFFKLYLTSHVLGHQLYFFPLRLRAFDFIKLLQNIVHFREIVGLLRIICMLDFLWSKQGWWGRSSYVLYLRIKMNGWGFVTSTIKQGLSLWFY